MKSSAILAFCGLLIAADLVQVSAGRDAVAHIPTGSLALAATGLSLLLLLASASVVLFSFDMGIRSYDGSVWSVIKEYDAMLGRRNRAERLASGLCLAGTILSVASFVGVLVFYTPAA